MSSMYTFFLNGKMEKIVIEKVFCSSEKTIDYNLGRILQLLEIFLMDITS